MKSASYLFPYIDGYRDIRAVMAEWSKHRYIGVKIEPQGHSPWQIEIFGEPVVVVRFET